MPLLGACKFWGSSYCRQGHGTFQGIWINTPVVTDWSQNGNGCTHEDAAQDLWGLVGAVGHGMCFPGPGPRE